MSRRSPSSTPRCAGKLLRGAALLAGAVMATTPVAALMFRFNNPDALLVLLMIARRVHHPARHRGRSTPLDRPDRCADRLRVPHQAAAGAPRRAPLALAYLVAAPHALRRRIGDVLIGGATMIVGRRLVAGDRGAHAGEHAPLHRRLAANSILELTLGYNGFGRLTGNETGSVGNQRCGARRASRACSTA